MVQSDVFDRPYFSMPVNDERVHLFLEQSGFDDCVKCFSCKTDDGRLLVSPCVYFGTLMIRDGDCDGAADADGDAAIREIVLARAGSGGVESLAARMDYAWMGERAFVLRAGVPGGIPVPYSGFPNEELNAMRSHVEEFAGQPFIQVLMSRSVSDADESVLFAGEEEFSEGFIGHDFLPLDVGAEYLGIAPVSEDAKRAGDG